MMNIIVIDNRYKLLSHIGLALYAGSMVAIGVTHFVTGSSPIGLLPVPDGMPAAAVWSFISGCVFLFFGIGLFFRRYRRIIAILLGLLLLLMILFHHLQPLIIHVSNPSEWAAVCELISFSAGAFFIADDDILSSPIGKSSKTIHRAAIVSKYVFALALLVFGIEHYLYAEYIGTLIPTWIPGTVIWSYFVMIAFVGASISIFIGKAIYTSLILLGCMFCFWVLILHGPRVALHLSLEPEWTSLFVAAGMAGTSFIFANRYFAKR
jgi:uncharacterized membrane protein